MRYRSLFLGGTLLTAATVVYTATVFNRLPDKIPTHWDINGVADKFSDKGAGAWLLPVMQAAMVLLFLLLPVISPQRARLDSFAGTYSTVCLYVIGFLGFIQVLTLQAALGPIDINRWIMPGIFILFGMIGNLLTRARRNYWMGFRTPWTLESEDVWNKTHRFGGRLFVAGSVLGVVASLAGAPPKVLFWFLMVIAFTPVVYSYLLYRRTRVGLL